MKVMKILKKVTCICLTGVLTCGMVSVISAGTSQPMELFNDTKFANGFRAQNNFGTKYSPENNLKKGDCLEYRDISPYKIYLIPDGDVKKATDKSKFWEFEEGPHMNFTDQYGKQVKELFEQRLAVNHVIDKNTKDSLVFSQYNNYGIKKDNPNYNKKLVRRVSTNKHGRIKMYYNSQNEIRNACYTMGATEYANDTWPHFLLAQTFKKNIDLAKFDKVNVSMNLKLIKSNKLSNWPDELEVNGPKSPSGASLLTYFMLRDKTTKAAFWVGLALYDTTGISYAPIFAKDQWGLPFYRVSSKRYGGILEIGKQKTIQFDLKTLVADAVRKAAVGGGVFEGKTADDVEIDSFNIGWEEIGHWETEYELSDLSAKAYPKAAK